MMYLEKVEEQSLELQKARIRNAQLKEKTEKLEKECETLANKIIATQVERAEGLENSIILKKELNEEMSLYHEKVHAIVIAEETNESLVSRLDEDSQSSLTSVNEMKYYSERLGFKNEMLKCLQEELLEYRLKSAESEALIIELKKNLDGLQKETESLKKMSPDTIARLQEELILAKTREGNLLIDFENIKRDIQNIKSHSKEIIKKENSAGKKLTLKRSDSNTIKKIKFENVSQHKIIEYEQLFENASDNTAEIIFLKTQIKKLNDHSEITGKQLYFKEEELRKLIDMLYHRKIYENKIAKDISQYQKDYIALEETMKQKLDQINNSNNEKTQTIETLNKRIIDLELKGEDPVAEEDNSIKVKDLEKQINNLQAEIAKLQQFKNKVESWNNNEKTEENTTVIVTA